MPSKSLTEITCILKNYKQFTVFVSQKYHYNIGYQKYKKYTTKLLWLLFCFYLFVFPQWSSSRLKLKFQPYTIMLTCQKSQLVVSWEICLFVNNDNWPVLPCFSLEHYYYAVRNWILLLVCLYLVTWPIGANFFAQHQTYALIYFFTVVLRIILLKCYYYKDK